jgi:hypothetical protein
MADKVVGPLAFESEAESVHPIGYQVHRAPDIHDHQHARESLSLYTWCSKVSSIRMLSLSFHV